MIKELIDKVGSVVTGKYANSFDLVVLFSSLVENRLSDVDLAVKTLSSRDVIPLFIVMLLEA